MRGLTLIFYVLNWENEMKREIYLDNAATTKPLDLVAQVVKTTMLDCYGNPSSLHKKGMEAETILKEAREVFAQELGALPEEIYYTSGGTESNNAAIIGASMAYRRTGRKIITSMIEHPSVLEVFKHLQQQGFEVITIGSDKNGVIDINDLEKAIDEQTTLVSIMHVNNEIGAIQPIYEIGQLVKRKNKETLFHVDAVQSFGKLPIHVKKNKIDLLSVSPHKFYGPRGIGLLYKSKAVRLQPLLFGGGQQNSLRSGTENVAAVAGTLEALRYMISKREEILEHMKNCKIYLGQQLLKAISDCWVNGPSIEEGAPYILNMGIKDVRSEVLLHVLEQEGIYVSSGSACSSHKKNKDGVLVALGLPKEQLDNAIRFSFAHDTQVEDLETVIEVMKNQIPVLRRYTPGGGKK